MGAVLSKCAFISTIASFAAPLMIQMFYGVHVGGWWKLTQYNFFALLLSIAALILSILSFFKVTNLTKDGVYDQVRLCFLEVQETDGVKKSVKPTPLQWTFKDVWNDPELIIIFVVESFIAYQSQLELLINMTAVFLFEWSLLRLALTLVITVAILTVALLIIEKILLVDVKNFYFLYVLAFCSIMLASSLLGITSIAEPKSVYWQTFLFCLLVSFSFFPYFGSTAHCRSLVFFLTPSHSASIVETYRLVFQQLSICLGFFLAGYAYDGLWYIMVAYGAITFYIIMVLLCCFRFKYFSRLSKWGGGKYHNMFQ